MSGEEGPPDATGLRRGPRPLFERVGTILAFGLLVGITGALLAILVVGAIRWLDDQWSTRIGGYSGDFNLLLLLTPMVGGLVVGVLLLGMSHRRAATVADIIYGVQARKTDIHWRDGVLNTVATVIGIGSGASVGHYAPLANMGATLGSNLGRRFRFDPDPELGIACGVAAAISTAFSAPIAAVLFAHEVILRHYSLRAFAPITVASSTGYFIEHHLLGYPPLFAVQAERSLFVPEFLVFVVIGLVSAMVAVGFMKAVILSTELASKSRLPTWLRPTVAGLGVGIMGQWVPEVLGLGDGLLSGIIGGRPIHFGDITVLLAAKILATALCIGFGFAGGVFSPALLVGVLTGALLGGIAHFVLGAHSSEPAFYAVCGMAAVASSVIGGPLTSVLIVFELTRNYELTIAAMISVVIANVVTYRLFGRSLFDRQLAAAGIDLSRGRVKLLLQQATVDDHKTLDAVIVRTDQSLGDARNTMISAGRQECHVLDSLSRYCGRLRLFDVLRLQDDLDLGQECVGNHAMADVLQFQPEQTVWDAIQGLQEFVGESIAVVDRGGYYRGVVYENSLIRAQLEAISRIREEEHAT